MLPFLCGVVLSALSLADLGPQDVLILVNENSPTSQYIAKMYRQYYPAIEDDQVLLLSGLSDCSGPAATAADEIITRSDYGQFIAGPVRDYLTHPDHPDFVTQIKVIITTAGMPYRIEDTDTAYADAIYPGGSDPFIVSDNISRVDVASVESELTCLWYSDYVVYPFGLENRMVNPYQGYRQSSVTLFERVIPGEKQMIWETPYAVGTVAPKMEGDRWWSFPPIYGTVNRSMHAGDIYLVCRLDGPKNQNKSSVFAVRAMLERAKRASNPALGVNPEQAVIVIDDVPDDDLDRNRIYNVNGSSNYIIFDAAQNQPPDVWTQNTKCDYVESFLALTNDTVFFDDLSIGFMQNGYDCLTLLDQRYSYGTSQADIENYALSDPDRTTQQGIILLATYGYNGDEGRNSSYILAGGPDGSPLFNCVNGAVFTSIESLNAVTMFSDVATSPVAQGKIIDFIEIGGAAAIGHAFEPIVDAIIDNLFLQYNLLADHDDDGFADLTFIEAAYTAMPYLSWSEVVIGDPLMRIAYGPGQSAWTYHGGDGNADGLVTMSDVLRVRKAMYGKLDLSDPTSFENYNDLCDVNQDGFITMSDLLKTRQNLYTEAGWRTPPE